MIPPIQHDGKGQPYVEWQQAPVPGGFKRAWIQRRDDADKDYAGTGRYLLVVRCTEPGRPGGNPTDFPIWSSLSDREILEAFVASVCAITSCELPEQIAATHN